MITACKKCRRRGEKLFLKGERCYLPKCAITGKNYPPGVHGPKGQTRLSDYGMQLNLKQKIKHIYGIQEKQLKNYFLKVKNKQGNIRALLIQKLEMRADNVVYRSGMAESRSQARQLVSHGFFKLNGRTFNVPSYELKESDIISVKENKLKKTLIAEQLKKLAKEKDTVDWLSLDVAKGSIKILHKPEYEDVKNIGNIQLLIEYYSR
ncbi:MAG: 30S ribosomal protein S4 [Candidatus Moranbacteria bacterium]|nr:30S ribosomal protein S4 [Candidatus Moranbacteria bacterium]